MRNSILACVEKHGDTTVAHLCREVPGFVGTLDLGSNAVKNVIFWHGVSAEAISAIDALLRDRQLHIATATPKQYEKEGLLPAYPLWNPDENRVPGERRWMPVLYRAGPSRTDAKADKGVRGTS